MYPYRFVQYEIGAVCADFESDKCQIWLGKRVAIENTGHIDPISEGHLRLDEKLLRQFFKLLVIVDNV